MNRARRRALAASNTPAKQVQRARQAEQVRGLSAQLADLELRNACKVSGTDAPVDASQAVRSAPAVSGCAAGNHLDFTTWDNGEMVVECAFCGREQRWEQGRIT